MEIEVWKSLDFLGYPNYQVSDFGNIKSLNYRCMGKERILKQRKLKNGYLYIDLCKDGKAKHFTIHKLVALAFLENPYNFPQVNHKDENKENNKVENLEFCTAQYNNNYGTRNKRVSKKMSKIMKGKYIGEKNYWYGKHHTEETKQKISKANKGKLKSEEHKQKMSKARRKPILQYTLSGEFVRYWDSATTASKELKINRGNITQCCKGKVNSARGFIWRYKNVA